MDLLQTIAQAFIIIEFILIALIVVAAYLLKALFYFRGRLRLQYISQIEAYFKDLLAQNKSYKPEQFKQGWHQIELIVPILNKLTAEHNSTAWKRILHEFCHLTLLPLGRLSANHENWALRFYAAQAFGLYSERCDDDTIIYLLNDPIPLVFYASLHPALLSHSERCINAIISRLSRENWITKSLFLQAFENAPTTTRFIVERYLMQAVEPQVRATCYNILLEFPMGKIRWDMKNDLGSKFINLKLSSLKYLAHVDKKGSIPILINLLHDPLWEVRTVCVRLLGELKAIEAIPSLAQCLSDQDWWVRLAAAQSLHGFGQKGDAILQAQDNTIHPDAYRVAHHVLNRL